ncbi:hypothetical protein [Mariniblastus fucicola]|uniref:Secreted protein n=1 Tax=Mariniblastus fucicola TaxID=980251 RepID=A0A5B9PD24_9BACT|nr:hypothetical protein [Mariniblastus fucicola]QEG24268.1 hypothetical protein MFFC18_41860 [Mariniblastus fucicola]
MSQSKLSLTFVAVVLLVSSVAVAQDPTGDASTSTHNDDAEQLDEFLTKLALESMPVRYVEDKDWGKQSERWDGVKVSFRDGRLRTKRRKKKVNHGTWDRYEVALVDPDNWFSVQLDNFLETGEERVSFDIVVTAKVSVVARQAKWVKGVQLYSISANGSADVQLTVAVSLGSSMDLSKFPPDLIFDPRVDDATIVLENFRIDRVSKAGGEFAQQVTRIVKKKLDEKLDQKEDKLVQKLNAKIDKSRDRFTLSVHEAMKSKWATAAQKLVDTKAEQN